YLGLVNGLASGCALLPCLLLPHVAWCFRSRRRPTEERDVPVSFSGRPTMGRKLYVGNLTYDVTDAALEAMFAPHGTVQSAQIIMDRDTGRSKGFGFVEMSSDQEAQNAIQALNGQQVGGRALTVNEARPREERRGGGGGGGGGYGGGRGGGGRRY